MSLMIRVRIDELALARLVVYYQQNGVVPKSRNALVSLIIKDHISALDRHGLLPELSQENAESVLSKSGYLKSDQDQFVSDLSRGDLLVSKTGQPTSELAKKLVNPFNSEGSK